VPFLMNLIEGSPLLGQLSTLLEDLQKLYKINWPPVGSDELVLFEEESVNRLAKRFGLSARSMAYIKGFRNNTNGKLPSQFVNLLLQRKHFLEARQNMNGDSISAMNETVCDKRSQMKVGEQNIVLDTMFCSSS